MQNSQKSVVEKRDKIKEIIRNFSDEYLSNEYFEKSVGICDKLFDAHGEILLKGKANSWACGIIHSIGTANNLFNKNSSPYVKASELYKALGVSSSTGSTKSKEVKLLLENIIDESFWIIGNNDINEGLSIHDIEKDEAFIKAQVLIKDAFEAKNFNKKMRLAKKALEVCDYCSDAYILLAKDNKKSNLEKKDLLEKSVAASLKLLGLSNISEIPEEMWSKVEIEPLLGAKYKLALQLWVNGEKSEATNHLLDILKHDKKDKLMIRSILINWLLIQNELDEAEDLLKRFENDYLTSTYYSRVVLAYKRNNKNEAFTLLKKANRVNPNVIPYIIRQRRVPSVLPQITRFGSEEEAMHYMKNGLSIWNETEGLVNWIKEVRKDL